MFTRKQYIIDKKLQLRTTFSIVRFVIVITSIIIIAVGINIANNNKKMENILEIQDNIVHFLTAKTMVGEDDVYKTAIKDIAQNHAENMKTMKDMISFNLILLVSVIVVVFLETILLFIILIIRTHRISGPVFVMSRYMKQIIDGGEPDFRPLRKKDELKKFYELFQETVKALKARKN